MPNPFKVYAKNQGPGWLKGLQKYVETPANSETKRADAKATARNHGGDEKLIRKATYVEGKK